MRRLLLIAGSLAFVGFGCSSQAKKDTMDQGAKNADPKVLEKAAPSAAAPEKAKGKTQKKSDASKSEGAVMGKVECSVKGDERLIEVREKDAGCEVIYTKGGTEGVVASAVKGKEHCDQTAEKIRNKLEGAGFSCK